MADATQPKGNGSEKEKPLVVFEYLKSEHFRVIHVDGAIGSVTPTGFIHMAVYSERPAIPRRMAYALDHKQQLGEPIASETIAREGYFREMDVDLIMNLRCAEAMIK